MMRASQAPTQRATARTQWAEGRGPRAFPVRRSSLPDCAVGKAACNAPQQAASTQQLLQQLGGFAAAVCLGGLVAMQQPAPAAAKAGLLDLPACSNFKQAGKIFFCEVRQGSGVSPQRGDLIEIDYTARAVATGRVYDGSRGFQFTLGHGEMIPGLELGILGDGAAVPAVREGAVRTLLVPPELAFGAEGDGCLYGLRDSCRIPPGSPVEVTFRYVGQGY